MLATATRTAADTSNMTTSSAVTTDEDFDPACEPVSLAVAVDEFVADLSPEEYAAMQTAVARHNLRVQQMLSDLDATYNTMATTR